MDVGFICPRCGSHVPAPEINHDFTCLENLLSKLYQLGVKRGLRGHAKGNFDEQASAVIGDVTALVWPWREAARVQGHVPTSATATVPARRVQMVEDEDTAVARFLAWQNIGWLDGRPVSGEAAWHDPRVQRRHFTLRYADALVALQHPLMRPLELVQIHRLHNHQWEWHMARKNAAGNLESIVREPTAPLAICRAALYLAGRSQQGGLAG